MNVSIESPSANSPHVIQPFLTYANKQNLMDSDEINLQVALPELRRSLNVYKLLSAHYSASCIFFHWNRLRSFGCANTRESNFISRIKRREEIEISDVIKRRTHIEWSCAVDFYDGRKVQLFHLISVNVSESFHYNH